jgi:hypothetical protein
VEVAVELNNGQMQFCKWNIMVDSGEGSENEKTKLRHGSS